jgi:hypothetical protein
MRPARRETGASWVYCGDRAQPGMSGIPARLVRQECLTYMGIDFHMHRITGAPHATTCIKKLASIPLTRLTCGLTLETKL